MAIPANAETIEMVDGRVFWSIDRWVTVFVVTPAGRVRLVSGRSADLARFLAASQAHGGPS